MDSGYAILMNGRSKEELHDYAFNFTEGKEVPHKIAFTQ